MKAIEIIEKFLSEDDIYNVSYREGYTNTNTNATVYKNNNLQLEYYCNLIINNDMIYFNNVLYVDFNDLILAVDKFNKTQLYPPNLVDKDSVFYSVYYILNHLLREYYSVAMECDCEYNIITIYHNTLKIKHILKFNRILGNVDIEIITKNDRYEYKTIDVPNNSYLNYIDNLNQRILYMLFYMKNIHLEILDKHYKDLVEQMKIFDIKQ